MTPVIVPCGAKRASSGRPASRLTEDAYFRACRAHARSGAGDDDIVTFTKAVEHRLEEHMS
jgi:hypothetical protein